MISLRDSSLLLAVKGSGYILLFTGFHFISACVSEAQKHSNDWSKEEVIRDVTIMFDQYHKAIEQEGLTAEFNYLDNSPDFFWVPPGYREALTYDSVRAILQGNANGFTRVEFHWDTLQVFPLSNTIASFTGIVNGVMTDTTGSKSPVHIIESGTVIKRTDGWKLLNGQSVSLIK
ncbi:MAG: hypothetical protein OEQ53_04855 [Saprospiraceae bacterium]|nr:hypothetical protein [Saprospiraceae bacterium]